MLKNHVTLMLLAVLLVACSDEGAETAADQPLDPSPGPACELLFGAPSDNSGLDAQSCGPACGCGDVPWTPPTYTAEDVERLMTWTLDAPPGPPVDDPYLSGEEPSPPGPTEVCGVVVQAGADRVYGLETYGSPGAAAAAGAHITHTGPCGLCSSLQDLAVYMGQPDLTAPVRECGILGMVDGSEANVSCLEELGFSTPCAWIWNYNTAHTRERCFEVCMAEIDNPHHLPDGSLNPCIQCDEDLSGPIFKAVSGRTRRNSGLPSGLCRPCDTVSRVEHDYPDP